MKKSGIIIVAVAMMLSFGGCSSNSANNLGGAKDGYGNDMYNDGTYTSGGAAYWDGYGVNSGRPITDGTGTTSAGTTGKRLANDVKSMGSDVANAGRDVVNGVESALDGGTAKMAN